MKNCTGVEIYDLEELKGFKNRKLVIFGAGRYGEHIYHKLKSDFEIIAFADNDPNKQDAYLCDLPIYSPDKLFTENAASSILKSIDSCMIFISVLDNACKTEIVNQILNYNIKPTNVFYISARSADGNFFYPEEFYKDLGNDVRTECINTMIPIVLQFLGNVDSVIDLGCGTGLWLSILKEKYGVKEILGVDGEWAKHNQKNPDCFMEYNLKKSLNLNRKFDLAMSIEVAEHLPEECAKTFVNSLCVHSDIVLFSAAIPRQPGTNHINCRYPSWWAELFKQNGYSCVDVLRGKFLYNDKIQYHYKQNMMFYIKKDSQSMSDFINRNIDELWSPPLDIIHQYIHNFHGRTL